MEYLQQTPKYTLLHFQTFRSPQLRVLKAIRPNHTHVSACYPVLNVVGTSFSEMLHNLNNIKKGFLKPLTI